jgi:hypothetical protein
MLSVTSVLLVLLTTWGAILVAYRRRLHADWREPVLALPVLIVESDDWGPGPPDDAARLRELSSLLLGLRDWQDNPPVVAIGVVLAVPGPGAPEPGGAGPVYLPRSLAAPEHAPIRAALSEGHRAGVFSLQLHGMEHFWPASLEVAAAHDSGVRDFLAAKENWVRHETLPAHLQARWIDASQLPSRPLDRQAITSAVAEETALFARTFDMPARVAVPVTFTWTTEVEEEWARQGIRVVVTPGTRYIGRDAAARLVGDGSILRNGDIGAGGVLHVVRDVYFEPALGHTAGQVLGEIRERHRLGRPALLEMHRFNFTGSAEQTARSRAELQQLLRSALHEILRLSFVSTETLAGAIASRDPAMIDRRVSSRLRAWVLRVSTLPRLRKLAWLTGLAVPAVMVLLAASALASPPTHLGRAVK